MFSIAIIAEDILRIPGMHPPPVQVAVRCALVADRTYKFKAGVHVIAPYLEISPSDNQGNSLLFPSPFYIFYSQVLPHMYHTNRYIPSIHLLIRMYTTFESPTEQKFPSPGFIGGRSLRSRDRVNSGCRSIPLGPLWTCCVLRIVPNRIKGIKRFGCRGMRKHQK